MSSLALVPRMGCKINVVLYGRIVITGLPENNTVLKDWPQHIWKASLLSAPPGHCSSELAYGWLRSGGEPGTRTATSAPTSPVYIFPATDYVSVSKKLTIQPPVNPSIELPSVSMNDCKSVCVCVCGGVCVCVWVWVCDVPLYACVYAYAYSLGVFQEIDETTAKQPKH